eukprot:1679568-Pyramimonas_sp.AAC.1
MSTAHIDEVRKYYHIAMASRQHRSRTMVMALDKLVHPAVPGHTDVIIRWCACRWEAMLDETMSW